MAEASVLVFLKPYLGDAVMALPTLEALRARQYRTAVHTAPFIAPLLGGAEVAPMLRSRAPWEVIRHGISLRERRFGTALLINRSFRAALIAKIAGIRVRIGEVGEGRQRLLTHAIPNSPQRFEAFCGLDLLRAQGWEVPDVRPKLEVSDEERERGDHLRNGAIVVLQPGARFPEKALSLSVLAHTLDQARSAGFRVALVGGKDEVQDMDRLLAASPGDAVRLVGQTSLRETLGVLAGARVLLSADTGVAHLAVAVGCPTICLFGPTASAKWGHDYPPHRVLRAPNGRMPEVDPANVWKAVAEVMGIS